MSILDVALTLAGLAKERRIFHSEADFQQALAWWVQRAVPGASVRLETRPAHGIHLDLLLGLPSGQRVAVELKYFAARFGGVADMERYDLPNRGAQLISRYDAVREICRLERFVAAGVADVGWAIVLTNDDCYWRPATKGGPDGRCVPPPRGTSARRRAALEQPGRRWHDE